MAKKTPISLERSQIGRTLISRLTLRFGARHTVFLGMLLFWALACGIFLISSDSPFDSTISKRIAEGRKLKDEHLLSVVFWYGALANFLGALILAASIRWWGSGPASSSPIKLPLETQKQPRKSGDWVITCGIFLLVAVVAGVIRAPRIDHSFTNDEEYSWRKNAHGNWKIEDSEKTYKPVSWPNSLFANSALNNHTLQTGISRICNTIWQTNQDKEQWEFSESATRVPSVIASIASVIAIGILGTKIAGTRVGVGAAVLLALSPWHVRYSVESRGYSIMLMVMLVGILASILALERRQLRWWALFGLCQALSIMAFAGSAFVSIVQFPLLLLIILFTAGEAKLQQVSRLIFAGIVSLMVYFSTQSWASWQLTHAVEDSTRFQHKVTSYWFFDTISHMVAGVPWECASQKLHNGTSAALGWDGHPFYQWVVAFVFPLMMILGLGHMAIHSRNSLVAGVPCFLGGALMLVHSVMKETIIFGWYMIFILIPFCLAVSWTADFVAPKLSRKYAWFLLLTLCLYVLVVADPLHRIRTYQRQPIRQVVEIARGTGYSGGLANDQNTITGTFSTSARQVLSYDPWVNLINSKEEFEQLRAEAKRTQKSLVIYFANDERAHEDQPEIYRILTESGEFTKTKELLGLEAMFRYSIYKWTPDPDDN